MLTAAGQASNQFRLEGAVIQFIYAFAGPYLEILTPPNDGHGVIDGLEAEYDRLYDGANGRLQWVGGAGSPEVEEVGGRQVWRHLAVPVSQAGAPRSPMYFTASFPQSGAKAVVDLRGADAE